MTRLVRIDKGLTRLPRRPNGRKDREHRQFVRSLGCVICGAMAEAAHIRAGMTAGMEQRPGGSLKSGDRWVLPLCHQHHLEQGAAELKFWSSRGVDQVALAEQLWRHSGDKEAGLRAIERARSGAALKNRSAR